MNNKELVCEYCKVSIKETDHKCPNCGADCTKIINEYKKQKQAEVDEANKKRREAQEKIAKKMGRSFTFVGLFSVAIFIIIIGTFVFIAIRTQKSFHNDFNSGFFDTSEKKQKKVTVNYQEEAKTKDYNVTLDNYELYEYKSENFPDSYNTKNGYQKIAFHFIIKNNTDEELDTAFDFFTVTADDYKVDTADLEKCMFCYTAVGKDSYQNLYVDIAPGEKMQGYVGYLVPKNAKSLKFKVGDYVTINMDNPAYQGE